MDVEHEKAEAERALRRGDVKAALFGYGQLVKAFPEDAAIVSRFQAIRELVQHGELSSPKAAADGGAATLSSQAEAAAARGAHAEALALYRRALEERPGNQLYLERMGELMAELRRGAPAPAPPPAPPQPAAFDARALLEELLSRVRARRRRP